MAIAQVQDAQNANTGVTSLTVALGAAATANNLLVAVCTYRSDRTLSNPSGWTTAIDQQSTDPTAPSTNYVDIRFVYKVAAGGEQNIQFGLDTTGFLSAWVGEYSGVVSSSPLDQTAGNGGIDAGSNSLSSGTTAATTQADEVAVGGFGWRTDATGRSYSNSFTEQGSALGGVATVRVAAAHKILSATGAQETSCSWTSAATDTAVGVIATFKAAADGGPFDPANLLASVTGDDVTLTWDV